MEFIFFQLIDRVLAVIQIVKIKNKINSVIKHNCYDVKQMQKNFHPRIVNSCFLFPFIEQNIILSLAKLIYNNTFYSNKVQMLTKTRGQSRSQSKYAATEVEGKLFLQINDDVTYKGILDINPYHDIKQMKDSFQKGQFQVITKTTTKICIKFAFLKLQLQSEMSYQLEELKKQVQQLEEKLKSEGQWEEEDLNSKANFDSNYIYTIKFDNGQNCTSTWVTPSVLYFYGGASYTTSSGNRRANTAGTTVSKMMKYKL